MKSLTFLKRLRKFLLGDRRRIFRKRPKISIIIPFSSTDPWRLAAFQWLMRYWRAELPQAEIVVGRSRGRVFCKGEALNDAVRKSRGRVIAILDADAYLPGHIVESCADKILENLDKHLWFVPYRHLYRLNRCITEDILASVPECPVRIICHPQDHMLSDHRDKSRYGHRYGAMAMIFPREAYEAIGCFDERFVGWGGEDVALLRALDTLYGKHKTKRGCIFHLWHPFVGRDYTTRIWEGQTHARINERLANEYHKATRNPTMMRNLADEAVRYRKIKNRGRIW
jgi:hypothetical protein